MTLEPLDLIASAAHYAGQAGAEMAAADLEPEVRMEHYAAAQVWASLAGAAATLEAARLTLDAQASNLLSALEEPEPDGIECCPGCDCAPSVLGPDGIWVCEEYPGCSALMESPK